MGGQYKQLMRNREFSFVPETNTIEDKDQLVVKEFGLEEVNASIDPLYNYIL